MTSEKLLKELEKNPFLLAPMAGITDQPFRSFMREMGAGILTTELVSAKSLQMENKRSQKLMSFSKSHHPVGVQIFGEELEALAEGARIVEQSGADFIDLNFGCPVQKIVRKGAGSACLKDLNFLRQVLRSVRKACQIPISIKVRTGWDQHSRNTHEVCKIAHEEGMIWISIHGRTRAQAYSGKADWLYIEEVKKQSPLPVIGNGDLTEVDQIFKLQEKSRCDGMMIGRGCLKNPWIFQELKACQHKNSSFYSDQKNYKDVLKKFKKHLESFYEERMFLLQYKKFAAWYSSGLPNSAFFRQTLFQNKDKKQVLKMVTDYFEPFESREKLSVSYEASLMQGHG